MPACDDCSCIGTGYPIILLDEPTSFLDMPNRYELVALLRRLVHDEKMYHVLDT